MARSRNNSKYIVLAMFVVAISYAYMNPDLLQLNTENQKYDIECKDNQICVGCGLGQVIKYKDGAWVCGYDNEIQNDIYATQNADSLVTSYDVIFYEIQNEDNYETNLYNSENTREEIRKLYNP